MKIIADSGSTKTHWMVLNIDGSQESFISEGLNPMFINSDRLKEVLKQTFIEFNFLGEVNVEVFFYGAGIGLNKSADKIFFDILSDFFCATNVFLYSDLLAACRALFGTKTGVVGILGTGSNACLYNGSKIVSKVPAGGFILGDEGSGAYLGKRLLGDFLKGLLPQAVYDKFILKYPGLNYSKIVKSVYKDEMPSRYLASFAWFLAENMSEPYVISLLNSAFGEFFDRNIIRYFSGNIECEIIGGFDRNILKAENGKIACVLELGFVGSVAFYCKDILRAVAATRGIALGQILKEPMDGLVEFHKCN